MVQGCKHAKNSSQQKAFLRKDNWRRHMLGNHKMTTVHLENQEMEMVQDMDGIEMGEAEVKGHHGTKVQNESEVLEECGLLDKLIGLTSQMPKVNPHYC
jgi:hypothetical protein